MARTARQSKILELIAKRDIETQDALSEALLEEGFNVTQATISRDIKELCLIKVLTENKTYKYTCELTPDHTISNKVQTIFKEAVISVKAAKNFVVVRTLSASASAVSIYIDKLSFEEIMGTVAGDDTVLIITASDEVALLVEAKIKELLP